MRVRESACRSSTSPCQSIFKTVSVPPLLSYFRLGVFTTELTKNFHVFRSKLNVSEEVFSRAPFSCFEIVPQRVNVSSIFLFYYFSAKLLNILINIKNMKVLHFFNTLLTL